MKMMITCKQATDFVSKMEEGKISFSDRLRLHLHLALCGFCKLFYKQSRLIANTAGHMHEHSTATLTKEEKDSIVHTLETDSRDQ